MPVDYRIDVERRLVISTGRDRITFDEVNAHQAQLVNDPSFDTSFNQLIDLTGVKRFDIEAGLTRVLASRRLFSKASRRALVTSSLTGLGAARMFETFHEMFGAGSDMALFDNLAAANEWLGRARM